MAVGVHGKNEGVTMKEEHPAREWKRVRRQDPGGTGYIYVWRKRSATEIEIWDNEHGGGEIDEGVYGERKRKRRAHGRHR